MEKGEGRDRAVGVATDYGLDGPEIESRWGGGRFSAPVHTPPGGSPSRLHNEYQFFPGGKAAGVWC
jgi:hypothetical protein